MPHVRWKHEPEEHDYPAALDFLELLVEPGAARALVERLRSAPIVTKKAKDILRASELRVLPADEVHVARDIDKVHDDKELSPILLVRGDLAAAAPLVIADGYHRVCAVYALDADAEVPCRIAERE